MPLAVIGIVVGLAVLTVAVDHFVIGATRLAAGLRLSTVVIGAVVIGFGTSAPELLVSVLAGLRGSVDLAVGNIVGSNVANLSLVLGIAALITPVVVRSWILSREAPLSLIAVLVFAVAVQGGLGIPAGLVLLGTLAGALAIIVLAARETDPVMSAEVREYLADGPPRLRREIARTVAGLAGTLLGAHVVVLAAQRIAEGLGLAEGFIGISVVAVGTSLPELATVIQAARKGETDLILGNLLGSNLFNAGAVGGVLAFSTAGLPVDPALTGLGTLLMVAVAVVATGFMVTRRRVGRPEGALLLLAYLAVMPLLAG